MLIYDAQKPAYIDLRNSKFDLDENTYVEYHHGFSVNFVRDVLIFQISHIYPYHTSNPTNVLLLFKNIQELTNRLNNKVGFDSSTSFPILSIYSLTDGNGICSSSTERK